MNSATTIESDLLVLLESMPLSCLLRDKDYNALYCNRAFLDLFGFESYEEYSGRWREIIVEKQPNGQNAFEMLEQAVAAANETGRARLEWFLQNTAGAVFPAESTFVRVSWQNEYCIAIFARDLTDYYKYLDIERVSGQRLQAMLDSSPLLCAIFDVNGNPLEVSEAATELFRLPYKQYYCERFIDLSPEHQPDGAVTKDKLAQVFKFVLESGKAVLEWMHQTLDGNPFLCEVYLKRVELGEKTVIFVYVRDLRNKKQVLAQLEAALDREQSVNQAKAAIDAKSQFLARVSHELRTPVTTVLGVSDIQLQTTDLSDGVREAFARINNASHILLGVVNDILDLSRIEAGKMTINNSEYSAAVLISGIADLRLAYLGEKSIDFQVYVDKNLPVALIGDPLRITQVLNNLLSNAFKYTESGVVRLELRRGESEKGTMLSVSVRDTGLGMSKEQLRDLQTEYTRFHERENRYITGSGLGMAIVYNLVKMMDGEISVESEVGKGTHVAVLLPQGAAGPGLIGKENALKIQKFETRAAVKKFEFTPEPMPYGRVLIVDDTEANLYVTKGLLAFYDLRVETCNNGYEAINRIKQGDEYDIIFMDFMMPGMSGAETMRAMRDFGYTRPIIALTASTPIDRAEELIKSGFDDFASKPIHTKQLNSILIKYIKNLRSATPTTDASDAAMMKKLRTDFAKDRQTAFEALSLALNSGDGKTAHRLAHSLKGVAGLIHEYALAKAAESIEHVLAQEETPSAEQLSALETELSQTLSKISAPEAPLVCERQDVKELLDKLDPLLESRNSECLDLLDELRGIPEAAILVKQIEEFEFPLAHKNLRFLKSVIRRK